MSPSCVHLVRTSWSHHLYPYSVYIVYSHFCHLEPMHPLLEMASEPPPSLSLHLCASGGVKPGPGSQRWIPGSRLIQGVTFPWPLCLVPGWAGGHIRANETNRLSWGVPGRRPFVLFLQAGFNRSRVGGWSLPATTWIGESGAWTQRETEAWELGLSL